MPKAKGATESTKQTTAKTVDPLLKQLLEAGAHFGQRVARWNPKMKPYIYGARGGVHIIDLTKTHDQLLTAEKFVEATTKMGGTVLFVGTKRQARPIVEKSAKDTGMPMLLIVGSAECLPISRLFRLESTGLKSFEMIRPKAN